MGKKPSIALCCRHRGLAETLVNLWEPEFEIRCHPVWPPNWGLTQCPPNNGSEDIVVSTLFYPELNELDLLRPRKQPFVLYLTDPIPEKQIEQIREIESEPWLHMVGCEPCLKYEEVPFEPEEWITYAVWPPGIPKWNPAKASRKIAVCCKKADHRFYAIQKENQLHTGHPQKVETLPEFLRGLPWKWLQIPSRKAFLEEWSRCRVMFYFGITPYTCVMFEGMEMGIPMVAYNHHWGVDYRPIEKYFPGGMYGTDREAIRERLTYYLDNPPDQPIHYPNRTGFNEIKQRWIDFFHRIL